VLFTITSTHSPATDLGYLLHKNPSRVQDVELPFGSATVFYPEANEYRCTAAVLLGINPIELVRGRSVHSLDQYVNDRPYVSSSFTSVAIRVLFGTTLSGRCKDRPELVTVAMPLELKLSVVRARAGVLEKLFEPLGYEVESEVLALDPEFPDWGLSPYRRVTLRGKQTVHDAITHLYVLLPVLDEQKHYYVSDDEVEKLMRHGEGWLAAHPEKEYIVGNYLKRRRSLIEDAMQQLLASEESADVEAIEESRDHANEQEEKIERPLNLHRQRLDVVAATLAELGVKRVVDFGCGSGKLLQRLLENAQFSEIVGVDVAHGELERASRKLKLETMPQHRRDRLKLLQGSLVYKDSRLAGYDAMAIVEVIEHLDPPRVAALERAVFGSAKPRYVLVTTPNREYNVKFPGMEEGQMRHRDHRFEWTRAEFEIWAGATAAMFGYAVAFAPLGPREEIVGAPSQMAVFTRAN